jgi:hypothetical protein
MFYNINVTNNFSFVNFNYHDRLVQKDFIGIVFVINLM